MGDDTLSRVEKRMEKAEERQASFDERLNGVLVSISHAVSEISRFGSEISKSTQQLVAVEVRAEEQRERVEERHLAIKSSQDALFAEQRAHEKRIRDIEIIQAAIEPEREIVKDDKVNRRAWVKIIASALLGGAVAMALTMLSAKDAKGEQVAINASTHFAK